MKAEGFKLAPFLVSKGFARVIDVMPDYVPPQAVPASKLTASVVHAHQLTAKNFNRAQIAALATRNEVLVVAPEPRILPELLDEARARGVPFATVEDLRTLGP